MSHDAVGEALEAVIEFGGDRRMLPSSICSTSSCSCSSAMLTWNLSLMLDGAGATEARKLRDLLHGLCDPHHLSPVFPSRDQPLQHQHPVTVRHVTIQAAVTSTSSVVSLKADVSKPRFQSELDGMKPKLPWMM